jgi:hypothetical protein
MKSAIFWIDNASSSVHENEVSGGVILARSHPARWLSWVMLLCCEETASAFAWKLPKKSGRKHVYRHIPHNKMVPEIIYSHIIYNTACPPRLP